MSAELEAVLESYVQSKEVAFSCSSGGKGVYLQAWNVANGGILRRYTGDTSSGEATCVCMAGQEYILCALKHKPLIFVWKTHWEHVHIRIACTGIVKALVCHPKAVYCVGAIADKINIWELTTGYLLARLSRHYQDITVLYFINNGCHFLSGGKDGMVITWDLAKVLAQERLHNSTDIPNGPKPLKQSCSYLESSHGSDTYHIWSDHSMTVTGITSIGNGHQRRVLTCSLDMNCKVYEFISGVLLATYLFTYPLSSLIVSNDNLWLYTGNVYGLITATPLFLPSSRQLIDKTNNGCDRFTFTLNHHKKSITGLTLSVNNNLISSCEDGYCTVWDLNSRQVLRSLKMKGPVVGTIVSPTDTLLNRSISRFGLNKHFGKQLSYSNESFVHEVPIRTGDISILSDEAVEYLDDICGDNIINKFQFQPKLSLKLCQKEISIDETSDNEGIHRELKELKDIHKQLYTFTMDKLIP